jgi:hypothetical protein
VSSRGDTEAESAVTLSDTFWCFFSARLVARTHLAAIVTASEFANPTVRLKTAAARKGPTRFSRVAAESVSLSTK